MLHSVYVYSQVIFLPGEAEKFDALHIHSEDVIV